MVNTVAARDQFSGSLLTGNKENFDQTNLDRPAGKAMNAAHTEEEAKRSSSVPSKIRGFTLKADTTWRLGDEAQGRDPRRADDSMNATIEDQVYPRWWKDSERPAGAKQEVDEVDLKIQKARQEIVRKEETIRAA